MGRPLIDEKDISNNFAQSNNIQSDSKAEITGLSQEKSPNLLNIFSVVILILFIAMSVFIFTVKLSKTSTYKNKQEEASRLETQLNSRELKDVDVQAQTLSDGLDIFKKLDTSRIVYNDLLNNLASLVPQGLKFSNLIIDEKFKAKLIGTANSDQEVAVFIDSVKQSPNYKSESLLSLRHSESGSSLETIGKEIRYELEFEVVSKNFTASSIEKNLKSPENNQ